MIKYILAGISAIVLVVAFIVSSVTGISLENTWLGLLSILIIFIVWQIYGISWALKLKRRGGNLLSYFLLFICILGFTVEIAVVIAFSLGL